MNVLNFAHGQMYVLGGFVTYTVYGQIPGPQPNVIVPVPSSNYLDTITVTVTY